MEVGVAANENGERHTGRFLRFRDFVLMCFCWREKKRNGLQAVPFMDLYQAAYYVTPKGAEKSYMVRDIKLRGVAAYFLGALILFS